MKKGVDGWLTKEGLAMIAGWRRWGVSEKEIAKKMGVSLAALKKGVGEFDELKVALELCPEGVDYMVEDVVLKKALGGDQKAIEFWLKYRGRMGNKEALGTQEDAAGVDYVALAQMIK